MNIKSIISTISLCLILLSDALAEAYDVTWTFSGTILYNGGFSTGSVPGININDTVTGAATYNTSAPPTDLEWGATIYDLTMPVDILIVEVNGLTFSSEAGGLLQAVVHNDGDFSGNYGDRVTVINQTESSLIHINIQDEIAPYDLIFDQSLPTHLDFTKADEMPGWDGNYGSIQIGFTEGNIQLASFSIDTFSTVATVGEENAAPVCSDVSFNVVTNTVLTFDAVNDLLSTCVDSDVNDIVYLESTTQPEVSESMLFFDGANTLTYTPAPDFEGGDSFTYTASDGIYSDTRVVTLVVSISDDSVTVSDSSNGGTLNLFYLVNIIGLLIALRNSCSRNIKSRKNQF